MTQNSPCESTRPEVLSPNQLLLCAIGLEGAHSNSAAFYFLWESFFSICEHERAR